MHFALKTFQLGVGNFPTRREGTRDMALSSMVLKVIRAANVGKSADYIGKVL